MIGVDAKFSDLVGVAEIAAGYPFRGRVDALPAGSTSVVQLRNVSFDHGVDWSGLVEVSLPRPARHSLLQVGDVILSTRGSNNFAHCLAEVHGDVVCSPHFFVIRISVGTLLPEFLAWQINQQPAQDYFAAGATGSHILNLKRQVVEDLPIAIPSLLEQQRIIDLDAAARTERSLLGRLIENRSTEMSGIAQQLLRPAFQRPTKRAS